MNILKQLFNKKQTYMVLILMMLLFTVAACSETAAPTEDSDKETAEGSGERTPEESEQEEQEVEKEESDLEDTSSNKSETSSTETVESSSDLSLEMDYELAMVEVMTGFASTMESLSILTGEAGQDVTLLYSEDWVISVAFELLELESLIGEIRSLEPPEKFEDSHSQLLLAADNYQFVVDNYPTAIDTLDVDLINECTDYIITATSHIEEATVIISNMQ